MILRGIENQSVEIKITNYQYPEIINGDWNGNWLLIYLNVKSNIGDWQTVDPSLTTLEVKELIDWFNDLSNHRKPKHKLLEFTEPNLSFEHTGYHANKTTIRLRFELESRPRSAVDRMLILNILQMI